MKKNKFILYFLEVLLLIILFITFVFFKRITYVFFSVVLLIYVILVKIFLKKKKIVSIYKNQVNLLLLGFSLIYLLLFYLIGFIINDFVRQSFLFNLSTLFKYILPMVIIIVSSEVIRYYFLSLETKVTLFNRKINLSIFITFVNMVLIDLIIYAGVYDLSNYNEFLMAIGFTLFASISCNLFYNYISNRYGFLGIILYRLVTILYVYVIPIVPNIYIFFRTFFRMIYPYILYLLIENVYSKNDFVVSYSERKKNIFSVSLMLVVMVLVMMLISCKFKYGVLVIGSESMTGSINLGDAVVFESYDDQKINEGEIIIFNRDNLKLVHRVISIKNINGEIRYYTKGDANNDVDIGYVVSSDIVGVVKLRLIYCGYPSLWFKDLFS